MKKLVPIFLILLVVGTAFQACNNGKTYAEQQEDERKAIREFIKDSAINLITFEQFQQQDSMTDVSKNQYVQLPEGIYMQILNKGTGTKFENRNIINVRYKEIDVMEREEGASNYDVPAWSDPFEYNKTETSVSGQFQWGESWLVYVHSNGYSQNSSMTHAVPTGFLIPLNYVTDQAHVKIIVPHKAGHAVAMQYVNPFFYEIYSYKIW